ncbi:hypothetical protein [Dokdonia sp. Hel_I_53]|uniref:hypothetical protein n=1 Tax=Dokdonia sp. Hel_I_53 TaxID=1566287 RepID=UPI00119ACC31|nr:hypothetical protein [Dokdonia sp. Hel_I_53]TVZ52263.1 hypothetical protein OD90_1433 [Dokdonia sp. Hel_I_53]
MVRLNTKVKGASLIESVIATVIIIVVFTIASITFTTVMRGGMQSNTFKVQNKLDFLFYKYENGQLKIPYDEEYEKFFIKIFHTTDHEITQLIMQVTSKDESIKFEQKRWIE